MTDFTKPVEILSDGKWLPATVLKIFDDGSALLTWGELWDDYWRYDPYECGVRNAPATPKLVAWKSIEDMGEAINHWFRQKIQDDSNFGIRKIDCISVQADGKLVAHTGAWGVVLDRMINNSEHSPTPWLPDSWLPCGRMEDNT